jgi:hypothetical protein
MRILFLNGLISAEHSVFVFKRVYVCLFTVQYSTSTQFAKTYLRGTCMRKIYIYMYVVMYRSYYEMQRKSANMRQFKTIRSIRLAVGNQRTILSLKLLPGTCSAAGTHQYPATYSASGRLMAGPLF